MEKELIPTALTTLKDFYAEINKLSGSGVDVWEMVMPILGVVEKSIVYSIAGKQDSVVIQRLTDWLTDSDQAAEEFINSCNQQK